MRQERITANSDDPLNMQQASEFRHTSEDQNKMRPAITPRITIPAR